MTDIGGFVIDALLTRYRTIATLTYDQLIVRNGWLALGCSTCLSGDGKVMIINLANLTQLELVYEAYGNSSEGRYSVGQSFVFERIDDTMF